MVKKCWTVGGDGGVNKSSTGPEPTNYQANFIKKNDYTYSARTKIRINWKHEWIQYKLELIFPLKIYKYYVIVEYWNEKIWYKHQSKPITEVKGPLILWNFAIQTYKNKEQ